jgi:hypothetical protein
MPAKSARKSSASASGADSTAAQSVIRLATTKIGDV